MRVWGVILLSFIGLIGCVHTHHSSWVDSWSSWEENSPAKPYSVQVDKKITHGSSPSIRFELRQGEGWRGKKGTYTYRSELEPGPFPPIRSTQWYGCSIYLPKDFPIEDNRLVLLQWWPKTKTELGEVGRSPSLALRYRNGKLSVTIRHSDLHVVKDPDSVPAETLFETNKFELGQWNDFIFQATWSHKEDGLVNVWWNKNQIVKYNGPVGYDDEVGPVFRFGLYRDDTPQTYVAYFSNCRQGTSFDEVDPSR